MNGHEQGCQHATSQTLLDTSISPYPPEEILQSRHHAISYDSTLCGIRYRGSDKLGETTSSTEQYVPFQSRAISSTQTPSNCLSSVENLSVVFTTSAGKS